MRKGDPQFKAVVDKATAELYRSPEIMVIYKEVVLVAGAAEGAELQRSDRSGFAEAVRTPDPIAPTPPHTARISLQYNWNWSVFWDQSPEGDGTYLHMLVQGLLTTLEVSVLAWVLAFGLGSLMGVLRTWPAAGWGGRVQAPLCRRAGSSCSGTFLCWCSCFCFISFCRRCCQGLLGHLVEAVARWGVLHRGGRGGAVHVGAGGGAAGGGDRRVAGRAAGGGYGAGAHDDPDVSVCAVAGGLSDHLADADERDAGDDQEHFGGADDRAGGADGAGAGRCRSSASRCSRRIRRRRLLILLVNIVVTVLARWFERRVQLPGSDRA